MIHRETFVAQVFACMTALLCAGVSVSVHAELSRPDVSEEMKRVSAGSHRYLVKVYSLPNAQNPGSFSTGSGELIKNSEGVVRIITNQHVVGAESAFAWVQFDGEPAAQKVRVLGRDQLVDIALLEAPSPLPSRARAIPLTRTPLAIGERVYAVGYPGGNRTISFGLIVSLSSPAESSGVGMFFSHQAPIAPGSSGGGLIRFNVQGAEELVGVNTQVGITGGRLVSNFGMSIRPEVIGRIIDRLETERSITHSFLGFIVSDTVRANPFAYELYAKQAYPPRNSGAFVLRIVPQSPAGRAGIQVGDIIKKLEVFAQGRWIAIPFSSAAELSDTVFFDIRQGTRMRFVTERGLQVSTREFVIGGYPQEESQGDQGQ